MCASAVVHLARLQVPRGKRAKTKMHLRYLSCQGHLDRVLMASPTRRFPDPCQDQKSASVRLATRVETYFFTSSAFTTTIPPHPRAIKSKKRTHKKRCFFFIPAPKDRPGQPRTLLGCNHAHQVALAAPQELPVPYQVQWIRPACLPNLGFWEGKDVEKAEMKWTPVVWHSWLENHPSPFLPTPIRNKTSSRFQKNAQDETAWTWWRGTITGWRLTRIHPDKTWGIQVHELLFPMKWIQIFGDLWLRDLELFLILYKCSAFWILHDTSLSNFNPAFLMTYHNRPIANMVGSEVAICEMLSCQKLRKTKGMRRKRWLAHHDRVVISSVPSPNGLANADLEFVWTPISPSTGRAHYRVGENPRIPNHQNPNQSTNVDRPFCWFEEIFSKKPLQIEKSTNFRCQS